MTASQDGAMRLDKWLWCARFFRSRSLASNFCETAGVRIAGLPVRKAHYQVRIGDVLTFALGRGGETVRVVRILGLSEQRQSPPLARALYDDLAPPLRETRAPAAPPVAAREPGAGRPTKAERRALDRLKGE